MVSSIFKKSLATLVLAMFVAVSLDSAKARRTTEQDERVLMNEDAGGVKTRLRNKDRLSAMTTHSWLAGFAPHHTANFADIVRKQHQILDETSTTCGDGDSFTITAPDAPIIEGCYSEVDGFDMYGEKTYSQTGTGDVGQAFVVAYITDDPMTGEEYDLWIVGYVVSSVEGYGYCISIDTASDNHPSDVDTWWCDLDQDLEYLEAAEGDFNVDCGCD